MADLPQSDDSLVIRTDFTDDEVWAAVKSLIARPTPIDGFQAYVEFVDDRQHDGLSVEGLLTQIPEGSNRIFTFLIDAKTIADPEHPVFVVDLFHERGRTFRVIPSEMWNVENNLSLANMDWEDFADNTDEDGVFRGFPE